MMNFKSLLNSKNMAILNRQSLINYFKKGNSLSEKHFVDLIESTVNIVDDGISREDKNGFRITPVGRSNRLISFYRNYKQVDPEWSINLDRENGGLNFQENEKDPAMTFGLEGNIGIGVSNPKSKLAVDGFITSKGRAGSFLSGQVPGDGRWHSVIHQLREPSLFEGVFRIDGMKGSGRYAISHLIAANTYGGGSSSGKINQTSAYYGSYFNRLKFRWTGDLNNYGLEVKTARHYGIDPKTGDPFNIRFSLTNLLPF
jgi:hypothetical protein